MARLNQTSRNRDADSAPVRTIKPQQAAAQNGLRSAVKVSGLALLGALLAGCLVYSPALSGPFVFDDFVLPFRLPDFRGETLREWMASVRPLLMLSYWFNYQWSGRESTFSYHLLTVLIHSVNTVLVGAVLWRILQWTNARRGRRQLLTAVGAGAFLLHPLQSESVAYIAGRSESLSALWCLAAWATMLYRPTDVLSWRRVLAILLFFGAALATKEHTVALAGVLLLTDAFAAGTSFLAAVRRNWRLYAPLAAGAVVGVFAAFQVLARSTSAGFQTHGIQWYEYAFTQARVLLSYVTLFVLPVGLTPDHDVVLSRSLLDGGAGLAILLWVALVAVAVSLRRKYPVAVLGFLVFLVLLMPTSSVIPIKDLMAERRMYLPFVGLLLVALDWLSRVSVPNGTLAGISTCALAVFAVGTYHRAEAWGDSEKLWESAIAATPMKARPYGNLASVYLVQRQCAAALRVFDRAKEAKVKIEDATVLATWALSLECGGDLDAGIAKMQAAVETEPSAQAFASLGRMYLRAQRLTDAERALAEGERLNPAWETTHVYRAMLHTARNNEQQAIAELKRVLARNPANRHARELLEQTSERSRAYP